MCYCVLCIMASCMSATTIHLSLVLLPFVTLSHSYFTIAVCGIIMHVSYAGIKHKFPFDVDCIGHQYSDILAPICTCITCIAVFVPGGCNVLYAWRIERSVTFPSPIHENCNDNDQHYHSHAQYDDEGIVFHGRDRHFICGKSEEGVVLKCAVSRMLAFCVLYPCL